VLRVESVVKSFGGFKAVNGVNLHVNAGEIVAVIGPNGAGKTTLFHLITGHLSPDSGRILFKGKEIGGLAPHVVCRSGITRSFQVVNIFPRLSVFENVQIAILARERKTFRFLSTVERMAEEEVHRILRSVGLFDRRDEGRGKRPPFPRGQEGPRDRGRAGREPGTPHPRRADGRDGAGGDGAVHPPPAEVLRRIGVDDPVLRARYLSRFRDRPPDHGDGPGRDRRAGEPRGGAAHLGESG